MSQNDPPSSLGYESSSRFTYQDLRNLARYSPKCPLRVIALIDFDAFYAQCETVRLGLDPSQPLAVEQFDFCIALNYAAKAAGLKRSVRPDEARKLCPDIVIPHVATWREGDEKWAYRPDVKQHMGTDKAALDPYRKESRKAFDLIKSKLPASPLQKVEKASIDEVFLDLSAQVHTILLERHPYLAGGKGNDASSPLPLPPTTHLDWKLDKLVAADAEAEASRPDWDDIAINIGCDIVRKIRQDIHDHLQYTCSAGISHSKTVAKLAAGHNKPDQQTVVRARSIIPFLSGYKFTKVRGLGGKLGQRVVTACGTDDIAELLGFSIEDMRAKLGAESGTWVFNVIRGNEYSEVVERTQLQSMLAAKTFAPRAKDLEHAEKWLRIFAGDIMGRLEEQDATSSSRRPRVLALHHAIEGRYGPTRSRQMQIPLGARITAQLLFDLWRDLLIQISHEGPTWPCLGLSVSVAHFEDVSKGNHHLTSYFAQESAGPASRTQDSDVPPMKTTIAKRKRGLLDFAGFGQDIPTKRSRSSDHVETSKPSADTMSLDDERSHGSPRPDDTGCSIIADGYECPKCGKAIPTDEVLEHLDWHVAMELQET